MEDRYGLQSLTERERIALQERVSTAWEQRLAGFPEDALLWLAIVPSWSVILAEACSFPTGDSDISVRELFTQLYREGFCEFTPATLQRIVDAKTGRVRRISDDGYDTFRLTDALRNDIINRALRTDTPSNRGGPVYAMGLDLQNVARAILKAASTGIIVQPFLMRWATLASFAYDPPRLTGGRAIASMPDRVISGRFEQEIGPLLQQAGQSTSSDPDVVAALSEVQGWIEAARPLEQLLGGELTRVLARAARRLELQQRRVYDEHYLTRFLARAEQINAFSELMQGDDTQWALHFVGLGGVGKTMLMRYISARYFADQDNKPSLCRIDFDYLNPDYPSRAPALLLDQLSQELRLYGEVGADKDFARFDQFVMNVQERVGSSTYGAQQMLAVLESRDFTELLAAFIGALRQLPQPVVIILDTCEELAKIRPDGTIPENVTATFEILERIHANLPGLRVVFSGRRPLASGGTNWLCESSPLPIRPYLRLHEMRGFSKEEARRYLTTQAHVRAPLVDAIIEKSRERGSINLFTMLGAPDMQTSPANIVFERYNPFDLAMYVAWTLEDEALTAEAIRDADIDRYIEGRIIRRIHHARVLDLLPAVALLGHFDRDMVRVLDSEEQGFDDMFRELVSQEWLQLQEFSHWRVKSDVRERLYDYYRKHEPRAIAQARTLLHPYLKRITLEWPLSKLTVAHFDVALRLLEDEDPQLAAAWWSEVEQRFLKEQAYDWAITLIEQLIAEDGAVPPVSRVESDLRTRSTAANDRLVAVLRQIKAHNPERAAWWTATDQHFTQQLKAPRLFYNILWDEWMTKRIMREQQHVWPRVDEQDIAEERIISDEWEAFQSTHHSPSEKDQRTSLLRPAVLATYAAALLHAHPKADRKPIWQEITFKFPRLPELASDAWVRARTFFGNLASSNEFETPEPIVPLFGVLDLLKGRSRDLDEQLLASLIAALENLLEYIESHPDHDLFPDPPFVVSPNEAATDATHDTPPDPFTLQTLIAFCASLDHDDIALELRAFALSLAGRVSVIQRRWEQARDFFERALALLPNIESDQQLWLDWHAPSDIAYRVRLEFVRALYPAVLSPIEIFTKLGRIEIRDPQSRYPDRSALASAVITLHNAIGNVSLSMPAGVPSIARVSSYTPLCNAHRVYPPWDIAYNEATALSRQLEKSLNTLETISREALQSADALDTLYDADRAILRLVRRLRLRDENYGLSTSINSSELLQDQELLRALNALDGIKQTEQLSSPLSHTPAHTITSQEAHVLWRTSYGLRAEEGSPVAQTLYAASSLFPHWTDIKLPLDPVSLSFNDVSLLLNWLEVLDLFADPKNTRLLELNLPDFDSASILALAPSWLTLHPEQPEEALRLLIRANVWRSTSELVAIPDDLLEFLGRHRSAEIALDEGEMLALRLPTRALYLFDLAHRWLRDSNDIVGEFIAGICMALVHARLGQRAEVNATLQPMGFRYPAGDIIPLPWQAVKELARTLTAEQLNNLQPTIWRPWLVRLLACIIYADDDPDRNERLKALLQWVQSYYGVRLANGEYALPAELDIWLEQAVAGLSIEQPARPKAPYEEDWLMLGNPLIPNFPSTPIQLLPSDPTFSVNPLSSDNTPVSELPIGYASPLERDASALQDAFKQSFMEKILAKFAVSVRLEIQVDVTPAPDEFEVTLRLPTLTRQSSSVTGISARPPYEQATSNFIVQAQDILNHLPSGFALAVELQLDYPVNSVCWEALIASSLKQFWQRDPTNTQPGVAYSRTLSRRSSKKFTDSSASMMTLTNHIAMQHIFDSAWATLGAHPQLNGYTPREFGAVFSYSRVASPLGANIVYLAAQAQETRNGIALNVNSAPYGSRRPGLPLRNVPLLPEELIAAFPNMSICILQAPTAPLSSRTDTDRLDASYQRRLAAALHQQGIPIIIVIPPLPEQYAPSILAHILQALTPDQLLNILHKQRLLDALTLARNTIMQIEGVGYDTLLETAFDLCLYFPTLEI